MGRKCIDLTGQKFGRLTVIERTERPAHVKDKKTYWICQCECGNITKPISGSALTRGNTKSCGCSMGYHKKRPTIDLIGQKFGKLTVIEKIEKHDNIDVKIYKDRKTYYICKCECGNITKPIDERVLTTGKVTNCGCYMKKRPTIDLIGQKFGKLTVIEKIDDVMGEVYWLCECECGNFKKVKAVSLRSNQVTSCGCNSSWKGGITPITIHLRSLNREWFNDCKQQANYTCQLTGQIGGQLHTHHLKAFNTIVLEAHEINNINIKDQVKDYAEDELKLLEEYVASWHKDNSNAVVLSEDVHNLFHSLYGHGDNTPEQFEEFKERYLAGEFDDILG